MRVRVSKQASKQECQHPVKKASRSKKLPEAWKPSVTFFIYNSVVNKKRNRLDWKFSGCSRLMLFFM